MKIQRRVVLYFVLAVIASVLLIVANRYINSLHEKAKKIEPVKGLRIGESPMPSGRDLTEKQMGDKSRALMGLALCTRKLAEGEFIGVEEFKELKSSASRWKLGLESYATVKMDVDEVAKDGAKKWLEKRIIEVRWLGPEFSSEQLKEMALNVIDMRAETGIDITAWEETLVKVKKSK